MHPFNHKICTAFAKCITSVTFVHPYGFLKPIHCIHILRTPYFTLKTLDMIVFPSVFLMQLLCIPQVRSSPTPSTTSHASSGGQGGGQQVLVSADAETEGLSW